MKPTTILLVFISVIILIPSVFAEVPWHNPALDSGCAKGMQYSRDTASCKQANCPPGAGRTYTLDCSCGEAWSQPYRTCYKDGLATHCVAAGAPCDASDAAGWNPQTGSCEFGYVMLPLAGNKDKKTCQKWQGDPHCAHDYATYDPSSKKCACIEGYRYSKEQNNCVDSIEGVKDWCKTIGNAAFHITEGKPGCKCNDGFRSHKFDGGGQQCIDQKEVDICKATANALIDERSGLCKCDVNNGFTLDKTTRTCVKGGDQITESVKPEETEENKHEKEQCDKAKAGMTELENIKASVKDEIQSLETTYNNIQKYRGYDAALPDFIKKADSPPYPNIPSRAYGWRLNRYERARDAQLGAISDADVTLKGAQDEIDKGTCESALGLIDKAREKIDSTYPKFKGEGCALGAKTSVNRLAAYTVTTGIQLPSGCDCKWVKFNIMKRTATFYTVLGTYNHKTFHTISACEAGKVEAFYNTGDESLIGITDGQYYGAHGPALIYRQTEWLFGDVESAFY